jgi:hypothetical protein
MKSQSLTRKCCPRAHFFGGSDTRIIISGEEALIRPRHAQDAQMKSQRSFGVIAGDSRHPRAHAAQSSTAQAQFLRPIRGKYSRASHKQRQAAAKLPTFNGYSAPTASSPLATRLRGSPRLSAGAGFIAYIKGCQLRWMRCKLGQTGATVLGAFRCSRV